MSRWVEECGSKTCKEKKPGAEMSPAALRRRGGKVGGGQILLQTWRPWQRVRFDPESDGEITEGFQVREENDAI